MKNRDHIIAEAVKKIVHEFDPSAQVVLFGSRARGDARQNSDYDFLVLLQVPVDHRLKTQILDKLYEIELSYDCVLGVLIENAVHWQLLENTPIFSEINQDGVTV